MARIHEGPVRRFVRNHNRLLTFIGAFIVFTTFIVKEAVRDNLKEYTDSIKIAQNMFILR
jgi:hypothetical protein